MPDDQDVAGPSVTKRRPGARPALSADVLAGLREAFEGEVRERLPRLRTLTTARPGPEALSQALRDAHALASSAAIMGEPDAARCAGELEAALETCLRDPAAALPPSVPTDSARLATLLDRWLAT